MEATTEVWEETVWLCRCPYCKNAEQLPRSPESGDVVICFQCAMDYLIP